MVKEQLRRIVYSGVNFLGYDLTRHSTPGHPERKLVSLAQMAAVQEAAISLEEARFLMQLVSRLGTRGPILEIGTLFGWSTRVLALAKPDGMRLITVDNYSWNPLGLTPEEHRWVTHASLTAIAIPDLSIVVADKAVYYASYAQGVPSMVFVDAGHSYEHTLEDIRFAQRIQAEVICGHDYDANKWPGVVRAVDACGGPRQCVGTLWVL